MTPCEEAAEWPGAASAGLAPARSANVAASARVVASASRYPPLARWRQPTARYERLCVSIVPMQPGERVERLTADAEVTLAH